MHFGHPGTVTAMPQILADLAARGLRPVTASMSAATMMRRSHLGRMAAAASGSCSCTSSAPRATGTTIRDRRRAYRARVDPSSAARRHRSPATSQSGLPGMPALLNPHDVYAADRPDLISPTIANDPAYVYVPDTNSNDVYVIDQHTMKVIRVFPGGNEPQHVVPSYDLKTLYVTADRPGVGSLTPIDPRTGQPGAKIPVDDAYNMYFTPDGHYAIVVQEFYPGLRSTTRTRGCCTTC